MKGLKMDLNSAFKVIYSFELMGWIIYEKTDSVYGKQRSHAIKDEQTAQSIALKWTADIQNGIIPKYELN